MKVPSFIKPIADAAKPAVIGLGAVGVGALAAQVGGAVAKAAVPAVDEFAARSALHEAAVDAGAGTIVDAGVVAGVAAWKGARAAFTAAPLLLIGTGVSALAPVVAPRMAQLADRVVGMLMPSKASPAPGGFIESQDLGGTLPGGFIESQELGGTMPGGVDDGVMVAPMGGTV